VCQTDVVGTKSSCHKTTGCGLHFISDTELTCIRTLGLLKGEDTLSVVIREVMQRVS